MADSSSSPPVSSSSILFSCSESSFHSAAEDLREVFGRSDIERLGPDLGSLTNAKISIGELARLCACRPLPLIRHLCVELDRIKLGESGDLMPVVVGAAKALAENAVLGKVSLQVWTSGTRNYPTTPGDFVARVKHEIGEEHLKVVRAGAPNTISVCFTNSGASIGWNRAKDSLADWPGGRVQLAKGREQISRAEFKLEEAIQLFGISLPEGGTAVDLGASPGGWTRILRKRGLSVVAVDPGDLDSRVADDPQVQVLRTTAGSFLSTEQRRFDMAVNDMRMDPSLSCQLMLDLGKLLKPASPVVLTLKTGGRRPSQLTRKCLEILKPLYEIDHCRQLYHNRDEITVVARRIKSKD